MSYWCVFLATSLSTYHSNVGVQRRRVTIYGPHTLLPFTIPQCKCSSNEVENRLLVTYELVEFEKQPVKVQDFQETYRSFERNLDKILQSNKEKTQKMSTLTGWTRISPDYTQKSPGMLCSTTEVLHAFWWLQICVLEGPI
jgi:hypothetical protein